MAKVKLAVKAIPPATVKAAIGGSTGKADKLSDSQLAEFANFGGSAGSVDSINNLNKRLLARGLRDLNVDYNTSLAVPIRSEGFVPFKQANTVIPVIATNAIRNAKAMGINTVGEFMANADRIISDPKHKAVILDPNFRKMYPNMLETVAQLYVDRNNEYKPTK